MPPGAFQVAAYPDIAPVLRDLYSTDVGEPIMLLVRAEMFGLVRASASGPEGVR